LKMMANFAQQEMSDFLIRRFSGYAV